MKPVWSRVEYEALTATREVAIAKAMVEMFFELGPFTTFGTITVRPRHDGDAGPSAHAMAKIIKRVFTKRQFKGMKFGFFVEKNKFRGGTHCHFVTKDEPKDLRWTKVWEYMHERYGRFQTAGVNADITFGLAAYLAKYCSKELSDAHWGFVGWEEKEAENTVKTRLRPMWDRDPAPEMSRDELRALRREGMDWRFQREAKKRLRIHTKPESVRAKKWNDGNLVSVRLVQQRPAA
jgi:hypothetical protein